MAACSFIDWAILIRRSITNVGQLLPYHPTFSCDVEDVRPDVPVTREPIPATREPIPAELEPMRAKHEMFDQKVERPELAFDARATRLGLRQIQPVVPVEAEVDQLIV